MSVSPETRERIFQRDNHTCQCQGFYVCKDHDRGVPCGWTAGAVFGATLLHVDHIVPLAEGGLNLDYNLQTLCITCHQSKTKQDMARMKRKGFL